MMGSKARCTSHLKVNVERASADASEDAVKLSMPAQEEAVDVDSRLLTQQNHSSIINTLMLKRLDRGSEGAHCHAVSTLQYMS